MHGFVTPVFYCIGVLPGPGAVLKSGMMASVCGHAGEAVLSSCSLLSPVSLFHTQNFRF